jgi:DNA-binding response OmpR family regulator
LAYPTGLESTTYSTMKKPPGIGKGSSLIDVLSVSPIEDDHAFLKNIFRSRAAWTQVTESKRALYTSSTLAAAQAILRRNRIAVVLYDSDSMPGTYRRMLECLGALPDVPLLIVTSRMADEKLWVEVLNLGAYDLLAKPFNTNEVVWSITSAWLHWRDMHETPKTKSVMKAAS